MLIHCESEIVSASWRMRMLEPDTRRYSSIRTSKTKPAIAMTCLAASYRFGSSIATLRYTTYTQAAFQIQSEKNVRYDAVRTGRSGGMKWTADVLSLLR